LPFKQIKELLIVLHLQINSYAMYISLPSPLNRINAMQLIVPTAIAPRSSWYSIVRERRPQSII